MKMMTLSNCLCLMKKLKQHSPPPLSPVDEKKLPFIDTVHFIIPKHSDIRDNKNNKRCIRHHSVLCKVCPIIAKAKKILHKSKIQKQIVCHGTDLSIHGTDLKNIGTDPVIPVGNLRSPTTAEQPAVLSPASPVPLVKLNDSVGLHPENPQTHIPSLLDLPIRTPSCTLCGCCICPRGTPPKKLERKIPNLLSLPIVIPHQYQMMKL